MTLFALPFPDWQNKSQARLDDSTVTLEKKPLFME